MPESSPALQVRLFYPGQRLAVAVSGGADSVALLLRLLEERLKLGLVLSVVHVHHGIRGAEADTDAAFVAGLATAHNLPLHLYQGDAPAAAQARRESLEEAARGLRYGFFRELIGAGHAEAVATAHTLDDQAETVLQKLLRGAWTEGLSGIHPVLEWDRGSILRPFLETTHQEIEAWLRRLKQPWREDASNRDMAHTRNRIRHEVLPQLASLNPAIARQLSRLAAIAADEERYWQEELRRLLPSLLLPGKPVRGGGRSSSTSPGEDSLGIERVRLHELHPAVARRVLREAARQMGATLNFDQTELLLALSDPAERRRGRKLDLPGGVVAEPTLREIRLMRSRPRSAPFAAPEYPFPIPGSVSALDLGVFLDGRPASGFAEDACAAKVRSWRPGDRVTLAHSRRPKKVKEVLDRLRAEGREREFWPVVEVGGRIVWMRGVEVEAPEFVFIERAAGAIERAAGASELRKRL
jgi:tRNA(Ile)-lysidine synthase